MAVYARVNRNVQNFLALIGVFNSHKFDIVQVEHILNLSSSLCAKAREFLNECTRNLFNASETFVFFDGVRQTPSMYSTLLMRLNVLAYCFHGKILTYN